MLHCGISPGNVVLTEAQSAPGEALLLTLEFVRISMPHALEIPKYFRSYCRCAEHIQRQGRRSFLNQPWRRLTGAGMAV
jgi:hypothetical protein